MLLTEELITETYVARFRDELKRLKASHLSVELKKTRAEVGHVYHCISFRNSTTAAKTSDILSEGEFRVVSLAAFLADTEGRGARGPIIFDDTISSLDHVYEEAAAKRLLEASKNRQVIVFTHRLSLLGSLESLAQKFGFKSDIICLSRYLVGEVADMPIESRDTDKACNSLANERLPKVKKAFLAGDAGYEDVAKGICRDIRVLMERIVENDLLLGIVRRHSREVNTKGKIAHLSKITPEDCKLVDEIMTKYSSYEHSQSEELPVALPRP